ncbi:hypothetical protein EIP75_21495 [Aquabacterium soli]|uniref:TrfB transcriptional repressor protein domain-containing protein n=1 Tax=Aquabacterium soli TaxID=2493092 RepID=A0A3R8SYW2_9BURK|nr:hypothetical protein [Aquabacterium soli]RRS01154.1 hypothetical protein EIP75_21495 [Aquabacterium soli]
MTKNDQQDLRLVRVFPEDLEKVLASLPRTSERTKDWCRDFFVRGLSTVEIGRSYGVEPQHVGNKVRAIRAKLADQASPLSYVEVTLSVPIAIAQEMQALYSDAEVMASREVAEETLQPILKALATARKKAKEAR